MLDKLAKKYMTPDRIASMAASMAEAAVVKFLDIARNMESEASLSEDGYEIKVWDAKDRYEVEAQGEIGDTSFSMSLEARFGECSVTGEFEVESEYLTDLLKRVISALQEAKEG